MSQTKCFLTETFAVQYAQKYFRKHQKKEGGPFVIWLQYQHGILPSAYCILQCKSIDVFSYKIID